MELDIEQKDARFAAVIYEHFVTQGQNPLLIPVEHLHAHGFNLSDIENAFIRLRHKGLIGNLRHGWGAGEVDESTGKPKFYLVSTEIGRDETDTEVYEVEIHAEKFPVSLFTSTSVTPELQNNEMILLQLDKNGDLYREPRTKFCHSMKNTGIPFKIINYFAHNPNRNYEENTEAMASSLNMEPARLRSEIIKMRTTVESNLGLSGIQLIESRKNSGYRLNPVVVIATKG